MRTLLLAVALLLISSLTSAQTTTAPAPTQEYVIAPGDTLSKIARHFYNSASKENIQRIIDANPTLLHDATTTLNIGKTLTIPTTAPATQSSVLSPQPSLHITDADPAAQKAISLDNLQLATTINGPLAQTAITLTFKNNLNRQLEGELEFPLPESATISGYALDVPAGSGNLVDGVPIEKERARQVFESEVRRGIDPGIIEQTRGNNFRTRIHPIPANGTRTVRITFISDLATTRESSIYAIPLNFNQPLAKASIHIDIIDPLAPDSVSIDGLQNLKFKSTPTGLAADQAFSNIELAGNLSVKLPAPTTTLTRVEPRLPALTPEQLAANIKPTPQNYFLLSTQPNTAINAKVAKPKRIAIVWDTSLSRLSADKSAELATLKALAAKLQNVTVDLLTLDGTSNQAFFIIKNGDASQLLEAINKLTYDGALRIDQTNFYNNLNHGKEVFESVDNYDFYLLFSDGLVTLGEEHLASAEVPVYTICSDPKANHPLLRKLAQESGNGGGLYLNLQRMKPEEAANTLLSPRIVMTLTAKENEVAEIYPKGAIPVTGGSGQRINFTGKLLTPTATLTLSTGLPGGPMHSETITLTTAIGTASVSERQSRAPQDGAPPAQAAITAPTSLIPTYWANQKIADLSTTPDQNADALLALGKDFNLVTPNTSLIVLETIDQYVRNRIVPPKSQPVLYQQFINRIEDEAKQKNHEEAEKIAHILALWQARVQWWEEKHDLPKDFAYKAPPQEQNAANNSLFADTGGATAGRPAEGPPPASPLTPSTQPVVRVHDIRDMLVTPDTTPDTAIRPPQFNLDDVTKSGGQDQTVTRSGTSGGSLFTDTSGGAGGSGGGRAGGGGARGPAPDPSHPGATTGVPGSVNVNAADRAGLESVGDDVNYLLSKQTEESLTAARIAIKPWSPDTPYLKALAAVPPEKAYETYLAQRKDYLASPAFYLDCGNYLLEKNRTPEGIRVLTNIAQLRLESAPLLRIAAYRLLQIHQYDLAIDLFQKAKRLRPDEPQSWRDLAQALAARGFLKRSLAECNATPEPALASAANTDLQRALDLYQHVIMNHWDRFDEIEVVALMETNDLWEKVQTFNANRPEFAKLNVHNPLDPRLIKNLDCDIRIVLTWDADNTDIDLHVLEPTGEEALYNHNRTTIGGLVSRDFTQGYGPEEYCLHHAQPGPYKIRAHFYGTQQQTLTGPVTLQATLITNFARPNESRQSLTLRLKDPKEFQDLGEIKFEPKLDAK